MEHTSPASQALQNALRIPVDTPPQATPPAGPEAPSRVVHMMPIGGTARVTEGLPSDNAEGILATLQSPSGMARDPYSARDTDLVEVGGMRTNVATAIRMGVVTRSPATGALMETSKTTASVTGVQQTSTPASQAAQTERYAVTMDKQSEAFHSALFENVPMTTMAAALGDYVNTGDMRDSVVNTIASHLGVTPGEAAGRILGLIEARETQLVQSLAKMGIDDASEFAEFVTMTKPDMVKKAQLHHLRHGDVSGYAPLAALYFERLDEIAPERIMEAKFGSGIVPQMVNGRVVLNVPGKGQISYRAAVASGIISVGL